MRFSIRAKLVAILLVASALPLLAGIVSVEYLGFRDFRRNQGRLYQASAAHFAGSLGQLAGDQIQRLSDWSTLSELGAEMKIAPPVTAERAEFLQQNWNYFFKDSPELKAVTTSLVAQQLHAFQKRNDLFAEIFVTDNKGSLVAATNRTSDYRQSDEEWWKRASRLPEGKAWVEGIGYDDSSGVHALEISMPVRYGNQTVGVLKAVLNVSALFTHVPVVLEEAGLRHDVVRHDGRILARLGDSHYAPLSHHISRPVLNVLRSEQPPNGETRRDGGWLLTSMDRPATVNLLPGAQNPSINNPKGNAQAHSSHNTVTGHEDLIGYANLELKIPNVHKTALENLTPLSVLVYNDTDHVFAPVYRQLKMQGVTGFLLLTTFLFLGLVIAQRKLVTPLRLLRGAAAGLALTAQLEDEGAARAAQDKARELVAQLQKVNTKDELEDLAHDFIIMSQRVLSYHEQLERELSAKTGEIQRDLKIAREFQESLLPREYPEVPEAGLQNALSLSFHHVYQPATTVCGDFFDVFKISEGRAGVFIADVMGHGARSALVTAILRTLLQDLAGHEDDPAHILEQVNRHFAGILRGTGQFVFASAFCMVIDTVNQNMSFASAGHPAPLVIERESGNVQPLLPEDYMDPQHINAALGLDADSTYTRHSRALQPGNAFVLYTDGVIEAPAPDKEEFGTERLCDTLRQHIEHPIARICRSICEDVNEWMKGAPSPDDICVIGVEIGPPRPVVMPRPQNPLENVHQ